MLRSLSRLRLPLPRRCLAQTLASLHSPAAAPFSPRTPPAFQNPSPISLLSAPFSSKGRKGRTSPSPSAADDDDPVPGVFVFGRDPDHPPRLLVVQPRLRPDSLLDSKLSEALNLASSLEEQRDAFGGADKDPPPPHLLVQNPAARGGTHADSYFGKGTVENVKCHIRALESEKGIDAVFVNAILSGVQQRNLEVSWGKPVLDRVGLIIEIFNAHAETKEAKLQSQLAALMYKKSRLVRVRGPGGKLTFGSSGEAEVVSARGRGSGGQGFVSGAGETELQLQRRRILDRRIRLLEDIEEVRRTRALQRSSRRRHGGSEGRGLATVAVVGYTNAGKSTLVGTLSESDLYSDDRLFATVDPRLRSVILPSGRKTLLSDTVGFISDLPVQLVEAFHATLEEVVEADLLVHVLDSSAPNLEEQRSTVLQVLKQIGVSEQKIENMIEVWNKVDLLEKDEADEILDEVTCLDEGEDEENNDVNELVDEDKCLVEGDDEENKDVDEFVDELKCLVEGEDEENKEEDDINISEAEGSTISEIPSSDKPIDADGLEMVSDLSPEEDLETAYHQPKESSEVGETTDAAAPSESTSAQSVRTSSVTGVGLSELLYLIDEKLNTLHSSEKKTIGLFDRKWRPSYNADDEKVAEQ